MDSSSFFGPPRGVTMSERVPQSHWTLSECLTLVVLSGYLCLQGGQDPPSCSAILLVLALGSALYRKQAVRNRSLFPTREWTYLSGERRESGATRQVYWGQTWLLSITTVSPGHTTVFSPCISGGTSLLVSPLPPCLLTE